MKIARITRITLWHVPLTSHQTYHMANGKTCNTVETVVLRLGENGPERCDGRISLPKGIGLGMDPDPTRLGKPRFDTE